MENTNTNGNAAPASTAAPIADPVVDALGTMDDNFIADVLGTTQNGNTSPDTGNGKPNADPKPVDDATKRYEYWQGQTDRYRSELDKIKPLADEYNRFAPVVEFLKQNPDAFNEFMQKKQGKAPDNNGMPVADTLKKPVPPQKPLNFDPAATDPGSDSFKYRVAQSEYLEQLANYMTAKQDLIEQEATRRIEQQRMQEQQNARIGELKQTLQTQYGFKPEEVDDVIKTLNSKESMSLDNLIGLYKVIKHRSKIAGQARVNNAGNANLPPPPPNAGGGGSQVVQPSEEESFFNGIAGFGRRTVG